MANARRVVRHGKTGEPGCGSRFQRGFGGFLVLALVAGLAATAGMFTFYRTDVVQTQNERATGDALAATRAALIAYAVHREGPVQPTGGSLVLLPPEARPGDLPCPDTDGDGYANAPCRTTASLLGRVPWKTLRISEPKDGAGETLWYALASTFREWDSFPTATPSSQRRINSDTRGNISVRAADGSTVLTNNAVAVVFAPGAPLGAQNRGGTQLLCAITNVIGSSALCANNYLEAVTGVLGVGSTAGPFTVPARSDTANDRLIYLTTADVIPALEMRVGNELRAMLRKYRAATEDSCKCYPWADTWEYSGGIADVGQNRGRFPTEPYPYGWGTNGIPALPQWVAANDWHNLFWYSVSKQNSDKEGSKCKTCSDAPMLTVDGTPVSALFITPGTPADGLPRLTSTTRRDNIDLYFEDAPNRDGAIEKQCKDTGEIGGGSAGSGSLKGALSCDQYTQPTAKGHDRDRLFLVGVAGPAVCIPSAKDIVDNVPCVSGGSMKGMCKTALTNLDACTCLTAARTLTRTPCSTSTTGSACQDALASLKQCKL